MVWRWQYPTIIEHESESFIPESLRLTTPSTLTMSSRRMRYQLGPYTFTIHVQHPNPAFQFLFFGSWATIIAPMYIMEHDIQVWNQSSNGYTMPYPRLSENLTAMIQQYFDDEVATCNAGNTPFRSRTHISTATIKVRWQERGCYVSFSGSTSDYVLRVSSRIIGATISSTAAQD